MKPLPIRIVGGSLAGLFTAMLLQNDDHDVLVCERSHSGLAGRGAGLVPQEDVFHMLRMIGADHAANVGVMARERIYFNADGSVVPDALDAPDANLVGLSLLGSIGTSGKRAVPDRRAVEAVIDADDGATIVFAGVSSEKKPIW